MAKENKIQKEGMVIEALPNLHFKVRLEEGGDINAHLAGKLKMFRIRVLPGDKVTVEVSRYDDKRGRIIWRKNEG